MTDATVSTTESTRNPFFPFPFPPFRRIPFDGFIRYSRFPGIFHRPPNFPVIFNIFPRTNVFDPRIYGKFPRFSRLNRGFPRFFYTIPTTNHFEPRVFVRFPRFLNYFPTTNRRSPRIFKRFPVRSRGAVFPAVFGGLGSRPKHSDQGLPTAKLKRSRRSLREADPRTANYVYGGLFDGNLYGSDGYNGYGVGKNGCGHVAYPISYGYGYQDTYGAEESNHGRRFVHGQRDIY